MLIKPFLIVLIVIFRRCKNDSSVINLTYSEQLQFSRNFSFFNFKFYKSVRVTSQHFHPSLTFVNICSTLKWHLHKRENKKNILLLLMTMVIWGDRKIYIEIVLPGMCEWPLREAVVSNFAYKYSINFV